MVQKPGVLSVTDNACCSAAWWASLEAHSGHSSTQAAGRSQDDCALQKGQNKLNVQQRRLWPEPIFQVKIEAVLLEDMAMDH